MSKRTEIIQTLLERFTELTDPMQSGNGNGDSGLRLMPSTYTPTVRNLERLLALMRTREPVLHKHVRYRYLERHQVIREFRVTRKTKKGKIELVERRLVDIYPAWVQLELVERGVLWIADHWDMPHEPMLPKELALTG